MLAVMVASTGRAISRASSMTRKDGPLPVSMGAGLRKDPAAAPDRIVPVRSVPARMRNTISVSEHFPAGDRPPTFDTGKIGKA